MAEDLIPEGFELEEEIPNGFEFEQPSQTQIVEGGVSKNYTQNWDNKGRVYYTDENGNKVDFNVNPLEKLGNKAKAIKTNVQNWIEETNPHSEAYKQKANAILTAETLPFGLTKGLTFKLSSKLAPFMGNKIAQTTAQGLGSGLVSGGVFGGGNALIEDENIPLGALNGAAIGILTGGALGNITGRIGRFLDGKKLKSYGNIDNLTKEERKEFKKIGKQYYNDYIQGRSVNNDGKISFTGSGISELSRWNPKQIKNLPGLRQDIKNSTKTTPRANTDIKKPDVIDFDVYQGKNGDHLVENFKNGERHYYFTNDDTSKTGRVLHGTGASEVSNNSINNLQPNVNSTGEFKQSKLAQAEGLPEELQGLTPEYQVIHNKDLMNNATQEINTKGINEISSELRNIEEPSALDFEKARQTVDKLFAEGRTTEAMELIENIAEKGSKAGQAVQAMSLWSRTTPAGAVKTAQNIINKYNKTAKNKIEDLTEQQANEIIELTNNIHKAAEGRDKDVATATLMKYFGDLVPQSAGNKMKTLRNISLLLNPKTFGRNITGNAIFAGMENLATKPLAAGIDKFASLFTKQRTRSLPQVNEYTKGLLQGAKEGIEDVNLGIDTRKGIGGRFDLPQQRSFENVPVLEQLEKGLDYSLRVPDRAFYQASFNESLANQMKAAGVTEPTEEMLKLANEEALESVYQNNGKLGQMVLGLRKNLNSLGNKDFGAGDVLIPYAQTPANVVQQGINYSPLGLVKSAANFAEGNQRQATLDAARALVGTGIMGGGYAAVKNGLVNKDIDNYEALQNYQAMGVRPNTINLPNGYSMSFNQLQPLSAPFAGGVALDNLQNGDYMGALDASLGSVADLSMLRGVTDFINDYNNNGSNQKAPATAAFNLALSLPSQFVPTGLNQINAYVDPVQRETYDPNPLKQAINRIGAKTPFLSKLLPEKYDVTGEPIQKYQTEGLQRAFDTFANPVFVNKKSDDATLNELTRIFEQTGDKSQLLPVADRTVKFTDINGEKVSKKLSGKELSQYQQQLGTVNKKVLDTFIQSDFYNMLDDEQKVNEIAKIERQVKQKVDEELFNKPNPQIRNIVKKLMPTTEDKIVKEVMSLYNKHIVPAQINSVYENAFGEERIPDGFEFE